MNVALQRNKQMMDHTCLYSLPHDCFSVSGSFLAVFNSLLLSQVSFFAFCTIDVKTSVNGGSGWSKLNFLFPLSDGSLPTGWPGASWLPSHGKSEVTKDGWVLSRARSSPAPGEDSLSRSTFLFIALEPAVKGGCWPVLSSGPSTLSLAVSPQLIRCFAKLSW